MPINTNASIIHNVFEVKVIIVYFMVHFQQTYIVIDNMFIRTFLYPHCITLRTGLLYV